MKYTLKVNIICRLGVILMVFFASTLSSQKKYDYTDGPYLAYSDQGLEVKYLKNGKLYEELIVAKDTCNIKIDGLPEVHLCNTSEPNPPLTYFSEVDSIAAISDVHGQYDVMITLLRNQNLIDSLNNWTFGTGHLVIIGDIMDRGAKVTECLWFLFKLEQEALKAGGRVHFLLGNHELMVLHQDVRYINPKYRYLSGITQMEYPDFFSEKTILGNWLRQKGVCVKINDMVFVHGGFSKEVIRKEKALDNINTIFQKKIIPKRKLKRDDTFLSTLYFENGPLWYRGYANPEGFDKSQAQKILQDLQANHLIVGHTSMPQIVSVNEGQIYLVDSSIKFGRTGQLLLNKDGEFIRGHYDGKRQVFGSKESGLSAFEYVMGFEDLDLTIVIDTDLKKLIREKEKEEYQPATLNAFHNKEENRKWDIKLRARGNMRKQLCHFPPLKLNFPKKKLKRMGFSDDDKMKLVLPCNDSKDQSHALVIENLLYKFYNLIDPISFKTKLINIVLKHNGKKKEELIGFFIESDEDICKRLDAINIEKGIIAPEALDREHYLKMVFFQLMIRNLDWSTYSRHNMTLLKVPGTESVVPVPYDFDYAGLVGQEYATPPSYIPVSEVTTPYFRGKDISLEEIKEMATLYKSKRSEFENLVLSNKHLSKKRKKSLMSYLETFYQFLDDEDNWEKRFQKK